MIFKEGTNVDIYDSKNGCYANNNNNGAKIINDDIKIVLKDAGSQKKRTLMKTRMMMHLHMIKRLMTVMTI